MIFSKRWFAYNKIMSTDKNSFAFGGAIKRIGKAPKTESKYKDHKK
jgi:hypothetical protein